ncbi:hypothetical protein C2G38_2073819 [Gigaspora rosea]|uniref:Uncharacterized protein n=1 Tax=Gigaspora rosea TaxID=44941 RepID=A0A397VMM7_9GLOM|nr:hypothetical protein C2G38_2073819 [Gigaspora rosea]
MIMNTADKLVAFLILFGLIILAFAHSLHLLLRSKIFQDSGINMFIKLGSSILAAYYMMGIQLLFQNGFQMKIL